MAGAPDADQLRAVEDRLRAILDPYRATLVSSTIYGVPTLARPGARKHDWFAGVQMADGYVKFNFLPMHGHPELVDRISPTLRKRRTGASVFRFTDIDDGLLAELSALLARALPVYLGNGK